MSPSRTVTVSHTASQALYNVGFEHSILKTLSVLSRNPGTLKNMAHNDVDFYVQNALKLTYEHL